MPEYLEAQRLTAKIFLAQKGKTVMDQAVIVAAVLELGSYMARITA
jgi:hypothetical protein